MKIKDTIKPVVDSLTDDDVNDLRVLRKLFKFKVRLLAHLFKVRPGVVSKAVRAKTHADIKTPDNWYPRLLRTTEPVFCNKCEKAGAPAYKPGPKVRQTQEPPKPHCQHCGQALMFALAHEKSVLAKYEDE